MNNTVQGLRENNNGSETTPYLRVYWHKLCNYSYSSAAGNNRMIKKPHNLGLTRFLSMIYSRCWDYPVYLSIMNSLEHRLAHPWWLRLSVQGQRLWRRQGLDLCGPSSAQHGSSSEACRRGISICHRSYRRTSATRSNTSEPQSQLENEKCCEANKLH